ncbi:MAG TPA: hypothetical protein VGK17_23035 [Propionicimonas sp.]|jgi:hypothetical protein
MTMIVKPGRPQAGPGVSAGVTAVSLFLLLIAVLLLVVLALPRISGGTGASPDYPVEFRVAAHKMSAADVDSTIKARLTEMGGTTSPAKVTGMTVLSMSDVSAVEPGAGGPVDGSPDAATTVWVVRAEGSFVGLRVPPGAKPIHSTTGYFIVDDATGEIVGMGMP